MKTPQFLTLLAACSISCFAGSWFGQRPAPVQAQDNVRVEEVLHVPNGGLQMKNSRGRVIGVISEQAGSGVITLLSPTGQPSVMIAGGAGGTLSLGVSPAASGLIVGGADGEAARLVAQNGRANLALGSQKAQVQISGGAENSIVIPGADGAAQIDLRASSDGGMVKVSGGGKTLLEMISSAGKGRININGDGPAGVRLDGTGLIDVLQGGASVFKAPPVKEPSFQSVKLAL